MVELLNKICVRIRLLKGEDIVNQGSGLLLKNTSNFYVLTAYHCVFGDEDQFHELANENIIIDKQDSFNSPFKRFSLIEIERHDRCQDWALLRVQYNESEFPIYYKAKNFSVDSDVNFRGFQGINNDESRTFRGRVLDGVSNNEFKITLKPDDDFKQGRDDARGLSGSGAFIINRDRLFLIGILKSVKGDDALNNDIKCCPLSVLEDFFANDFYEIQDDLLKDTAAENGFSEISISDIRDINEKIKEVCNDFPDYRIKKLCRDIALGKSETQRISDRDMSAMKFRIFDACQEELMDFVEAHEDVNLSNEEINTLLDKFTERAAAIIRVKSTSYSYPTIDNDLLRKIVLNLINDCYLSFDKKGIYE